MVGNVTIRPAQRADIPTLAHIANAANAKSILHRRIAPYQVQYPIDYYQWRLKIIRERFAQPDLRTIVAEDPSTGEILGSGAWLVEGSDTALYKRWVGESTWANWLESRLVWVERKWCRYITDRSIDYEFLNNFMAAIVRSGRSARPACLHCHLIVVNPAIQSRGVGRMIINWAMELAVREDLPIYLEANLEATGFYEKLGFSKLSKDVIVHATGQGTFHIPAYVWEGEDRKGRWLERDASFDGTEERWNWKDDVLSK
ncbi:acyl-CoA N-acyltransferase [Pseudovirgaria hyperparasitica]|uniref:Acyl-CoA N-acyltransferase n=1 Tax=Pseudovirgaria hyperparasitica TaxID=470096 RepID=A0A6A6VVJ7_9PEZI|nr:acyl-CoA N-acyltransferase [Pseudovirgaria hyperparasitica]KAF2753271.1 acyl-CoA N-acyltransferase [Pseudovirgaria hyperparasitica]